MTLEEAKGYLNQVLFRLESETPPESVDTLMQRFDNAKEILKVENNYIYVIVKDGLNKLLIEKFSSRRMNEILNEITKDKMGFKFITQEEAEKEK